MPRVVEYKKGAVIFFDGEKSDSIFILKNGSVEIYSHDIGTNKPVVTHVSNGEFFGVRNTIINHPQTSQAVATSQSSVILMSVQEFEDFMEKDKNLSLTMITRFCQRLKNLHARLYLKFNAKKMLSSEHGMFRVAKGFFNSSSYMQCYDIAQKFMQLYPESRYSEEIKDFIETSEKHIAEIPEIKTAVVLADPEEMQIFLSDAFDKYEKEIPAGQVVFSEFEEGNSVFLVLSGIVQSNKFIGNRNLGISLAFPGEFFGLNGLIDQNLRDLTTITTTDVKVLEIPLDDFWAIVSSSPKIAFMVLRLLSKRINDDRMLLKNIYITDLQSRLKDLFVVLDTMGLCEKMKGHARKIHLSAADIATWTSELLEVIEEELETLEKHGVIFQSDEGWFIVNDIEEARRVSSGDRIINTKQM